MDEQVVVYDCIEKLKGYNFVGIVDFDEFVYSRISHKHSLKGMLVNHYLYSIKMCHTEMCAVAQWWSA